jgi:hypothetical protein
MASSSEEIVPVWTLATGDLRLPPAIFEAEMTQQRLFELRSVLSALTNRLRLSKHTRPLQPSIAKMALHSAQQALWLNT